MTKIALCTVDINNNKHYNQFMKHKELSILYLYILLAILMFIFTPFNVISFLCLSLSLLVLAAFYIVFKKRITKRIIACFLLIVIFQVIFLFFIYKIGRVETLVATTDNINQANKVQNVLLDNYFSTKLSKDGTRYEIFAICNKNEIDNIMIVLSESDAINQNVGLKLFDKGDFTTTKENKRKKLINNINNRLTTVIRKIEDVENASVSVSIPEQAMFVYDNQPITATIYLETETEDIHRHKRMEKSIKNLLISTITGLTEENLTININVVR